ncbi:sensor histidine kinase KdpD [Lacinutrix sp. Bg11-31]|uniref:sensor histidine kinase n=1 Tax=Lacinutrix sp. Bg11-31 TaxID=2057808 RepID=UPI000C30AD01|nr:HAMP domain-containing sensor histidine kinase [Lacinutrix sp. Bg11-31]AUC81907.1 two-component sensor histidine kinase [Lacinutrix sp. Bg11-31]
MSKKVFFVLAILMSLSLIGIIFVQSYYISNSVSNKEDNFNFNVKQALSKVSKNVEYEEFRDYFNKIRPLIAQDVDVIKDTTAIRNLYVRQEDQARNETLVYSYGILEENYKLSPALFDIGLDTISIKKIISKKETKVFKANDIDGNLNNNEVFAKYSNTEKFLIDDYYKDFAYTIPIHQRITKEKLNRLLTFELQHFDIGIDYEFAIYSSDLATKIQTDNFELEDQVTMEVPIFSEDNGNYNYRLLVNFPDRNKFIWSSVIGMLGLSVLFTSIIIIAFVTALSQIIKQRQIAEIKTDFINNMTHEFKTPIATINLALDSIKNPKIIDDKEKVKRYLQMIREENKRMHAQVENVLRISKLEKNELNISKEGISLHDLIEDAISHVELIVEDRQGHIETELKATKSSVLANETHFINVLVNILDNAIKYSPEAPKITVETVNVGNNILVNIKDEGSGMSKAAVKRVFEKFYREHTGNIHNVKGHGLGLSYVKRIVEDHSGHISVTSEKGKGSAFTIKLPLIS